MIRARSWLAARIRAVAVVSAFALAIGGPGLAAHAAPLRALPTTTITVDDSSVSCASWTGCSSGTFNVNAGVGATAYHAAVSGAAPYTVTQGATNTAGLTGTVTLTAASYNSGAAYVFLDLCTTGTSSPATCSALGAHLNANGAQTFTVPASNPYWIEVLGDAASGGFVNGIRVVVTVAAPVPDTIAYPSVDMGSVGDSVTGFFGFLAPVLWLVGGIAIGGLLLHKARGLF